MSGDSDDDASTFIAFAGMPVLSRAAFLLHSHGVLNSVTDGHPGFVTDEYLNAINAETTVAAAELEAAGMWSRRDGGYFIVADEMVGMMIDHNEVMERLAADCEARGSHRVDDEQAEAGWAICADCGVPLHRPDGGPVALPDGGRLGPDPRAPG